MKKITRGLLCFLIIAAMFLCSCGEATTPNDQVTGDTTTAVSDTPTEPEFADANHKITISDVESILVENGLRTNINKWNADGGVWHGGMQMRVCHTERGTYCAFKKIQASYGGCGHVPPYI